ncbi:carbohydrate kinase [Microtetraspora sp. NBRC 16547]|nr:carbohydrate kinase [Microtetraspora sp. NBRC 16547]
MIKAVGYDGTGAEAVVARQEAGVTRPAPGWAEQDMDAVWDAVASTVRRVVQQLGSGVDFVAVTAQGDGCWLVDAAGSPAGPAILWNDGRAAGIVESWMRSGVVERAFRINGSLTASGLPNAILTWLARHDPDRLERSRALLTCGGWIFFRLTGEIACDESDGSAPFMDPRTRRYSPELLDLFGLEWAARLLPELRDDAHRVAELNRDAAALLDLPAGTPVVMAPYDIASTALGVGAVDTGQACSILGTTLCTQAVVDRLELEGEPSGITVASGVPDRYLRAFPTFAGIEVIQWACRLLGLRDPADLGELAARSAPGAGGLAFLPYFSPAGERAPFLDPLARGAFLGMSFEHGPEQIARATMEGLALVIQDCLIAAGGRPRELRVCGGGAASPLWLQMIADVTGAPVLRSRDAEVGARGAFLTGLVATGGADTIAAAVQEQVRLGDAVEPDPAGSVLHAHLFEDFLALREATAVSWPLLARMRDRSRS